MYTCALPCMCPRVLLRSEEGARALELESQLVLSCLLCRSSRQMLLTSLPSPQCLFSLVFFTINCKYVADFDKCSQSLVAVFTVMALKVFWTSIAEACSDSSFGRLEVAFLSFRTCTISYIPPVPGLPSRFYFCHWWPLRGAWQGASSSWAALCSGSRTKWFASESPMQSRLDSFASSHFSMVLCVRCL